MGLSELLGSLSPTGAAEGPAPESDTAPAPAKPAEDDAEELGLEGEHVPLGRFIELNKKRKEDRDRAGKLEKELGELKAKHEAYAKLHTELYGKFEKPEDQMREDATVAEALWALREKPEIKAALALIQQHSQGAAKVSDRSEKPAQSTAAADPRVEQLVQERMRDVARDVLRDAKVRKELHGTLVDYVLQQNPNPTREAVLSTMNEYVVAQGWTKEFIREAPPSKQRPTPLPNPGGLNAGTPVEKGKEAPKNEAPKTLSAYQRENSRLLHEKLAQRGVER